MVIEDKEVGVGLVLLFYKECELENLITVENEEYELVNEKLNLPYEMIKLVNRIDNVLM